MQAALESIIQVVGFVTLSSAIAAVTTQLVMSLWWRRTQRLIFPTLPMTLVQLILSLSVWGQSACIMGEQFGWAGLIVGGISTPLFAGPAAIFILLWHLDVGRLGWFIAVIAAFVSSRRLETIVIQKNNNAIEWAFALFGRKEPAISHDQNSEKTA